MLLSVICAVCQTTCALSAKCVSDDTVSTSQVTTASAPISPFTSKFTKKAVWTMMTINAFENDCDAL